MFENFPYTDMHQLNLDWIIKIAKDFLEQYTQIQDTINQGLEDLDAKAKNLQQLLQNWYDTHSQDIANQLADALQDLNDWYTQHQEYLNQYLQDSITAFNASADRKAQEAIASIPGDYTELYNSVATIPPQVNNPYAMADEVPGYYNPDGTIHEQTGTLEVANTKYFPFERNLPVRLVIYVKTSNYDEPTLWCGKVFYDADYNVLSRGTSSAQRTGHTDDGYTIYEYVTDNASTGNSEKFVRVSFRTYGEHYAQYMYRQTNYAYNPNYKDVYQKIEDTVNNAVETHYKFDKYNLRSIAHRGYTENGEPENTFWSFKSAVNNRFPFIETDLAFTSDNVPVLLHDSTINRTARYPDGSEIPTEINIHSITYAQALEYDFGIWKGSQYAGTKIPTLADFLVFCRNTDTYPYIELKYSVGTTQENVNSVIELIKRYHMIDCVTFISFDSVDFLRYVRNADDTVRLGVLLNYELSHKKTISQISNMNSYKTAKNRVFWDYEYATFMEEETAIVNAAIRNGVELEVWTMESTANTRNLNNYITGATANGINFAELKKQKAMN